MRHLSRYTIRELALMTALTALAIPYLGSCLGAKTPTTAISTSEIEEIARAAVEARDGWADPYINPDFTVSSNAIQVMVKEHADEESSVLLTISLDGTVTDYAKLIVCP